jgi:hypothetical protein
MSLFYPPDPNIESDLINVTKFIKGFRFKINPISNTGDIKKYNFYAKEYTISTRPNSNETNYLINSIPYSKQEQYYYYVPKTEGFYEIAIFTESPLGYESTGLLVTGKIEQQNFIKEINIKNINYYDGVSGKMVYATGNEISLTTDKTIFGWEYDFIAESSEEVRKYTPEVKTFNFQSYLDTTINFVDRFIYNDNNNLFLDSTSLRKTDNDIRLRNSPHLTVNEFSIFEPTENITTIYNQNDEQIPSINSRYTSLNYDENFLAYGNKHIKYIEGQYNDGSFIYNQDLQSQGEFISGQLLRTGISNQEMKSYIPVYDIGYYNNYYTVIEAIDHLGNSSAGGNINDLITGGSVLNNYSNENGYKIFKINHKQINEERIKELFKNYYREGDNGIVFEFKNGLPEDELIDGIILFPEKYTNNINDSNQQKYQDVAILIDNLSQASLLAEQSKNHSLTVSDNQIGLNYTLKTYLNKNSILCNDNIFRVKLYYLNRLETSALNFYLNYVPSSYTNNHILGFLENTSLIDKYIYLNKFIKKRENYESTIAASYQGIVYFFTPESYSYISWPDSDYVKNNLNNQGARMLDFYKDGIAFGPQFFNYFPRSQALITGGYPSDNKYRSTYRCLDSYKYGSSVLDPINDYPEDVPTGIYVPNPSFLGVYDPGNIGDQESPSTPDFKNIGNDLKLFSSKNIYSIKVISVGIQGNDTYSIIEFVLDIPDAEDFIVQGISGTDSILEKGIKEINGINYHYFIAKFISSCGIENDPILNGEQIDAKNIVDSKKMISFIVYPTKMKIVKDLEDEPDFGDFYLLCSNLTKNEFVAIKQCPPDLLKISNGTDCVKSCCASQNDVINSRAPKNQFYILSRYIANQSNEFLDYGKIIEAKKQVLGSTSWFFDTKSYSLTNHLYTYQKPTRQDQYLHLILAFYPEHEVTIHKILIFMKQTNNLSISSNEWAGSDIIEQHMFNEIVKEYPIQLYLPTFNYSNKNSQLYQDIINKYNEWVKNQQTFAIRVVIIDKSGDQKEQTFVFQHQ